MMQNKTYVLILNSDETFSTTTCNNKFDALILLMNNLYETQRIVSIDDFSIIEKSINVLDNLDDMIKLCNAFIDGDCITGVIEIKSTDYFDKELFSNIDPI